MFLEITYFSWIVQFLGIIVIIVPCDLFLFLWY